MKRRVRFALLGLLVIAGLGAWQLSSGDTYFRQQRNLKKADAHVPAVRQKLDAVPEFKHLKVAHYTAGGGTLLVHGAVGSEADIRRVQTLVEQTAPPVPVVYQLTTPGNGE